MKIKQKEYRCIIHKHKLIASGYKFNMLVYHCKICKELYFKDFLDIVENNKDLYNRLKYMKKIDERKQLQIIKSNTPKDL